MSYVTLIDLARQVKSRSGSTATLSGSTVIKENLTVIGSFSGGTISGGTFYSGSTNLYDIFTTKSSATGNYVDVSGDTMTGKLTTPNLSATTINSNNFTGITVSATTLSADTVYGNTANPYYYKTGPGALALGINGVGIDSGAIDASSTIKGSNLSATTSIFSGTSNINSLFASASYTGNISGNSISASTEYIDQFIDLKVLTSLPVPKTGRIFFSGGTLNACMYNSGGTAIDWVVMNKTGFI